MKTRLPLLKLLLIVILAISALPAAASAQSITGQSGGQKIFLTLVDNNYNPYLMSPDLRVFTTTGPVGGTSAAIAVNPSQPQIVYAGSWGGGVFKSTDGGSNWQRADKGLTNRYIQSLAIDPSQPNTIFAGTYGNGVFKSTDAGATWKATGGGLNANAVVYTIAVAPHSDPSAQPTLYVGTRAKDSGLTAPFGGGAYKSVDGGASWYPVMRGLGEDWVYSLAINPKMPWIVFAATHSQGMYKTTDAGDLWKPINNGLTDLSTRIVALDPATPDILYVATWHYGNGDGPVYRSLDAGDSWAPIAKGINCKILTLTLDPHEKNAIYAGTWPGGSCAGGVYKGTYVADQGFSWGPAGNALNGASIYGLAVDPSQAGNVYVAASTRGVYKTTDAGRNWAARNQGFFGAQIETLAATSAAKLLAGSYGLGVFRSTQGASWAPVNNGLPNPWINNLSLDPSNASALYAGTNGSGVFKTVNLGDTWNAINQGMSIGSLSTSPDGGALPPLLADKYDAAAFANDGVSAQVLETASVYKVIADPKNAQVVYAGTSRGVYKTTASSDWTLIGPLSNNPEKNNNPQIYDLTFDPGSGTLFAATNNGVFVTTDHGTTWGQAGLAGQTVWTLIIPPGGPMLAGVGLTANGDSGLYKSFDGGASWAHTNWEVGPGPVTALAYRVIAGTPNRLVIFAATSYGASNDLYISTDGGSAFMAAGLGLGNTDLIALAPDPTDPALVYLGTNGSGVYTVRLLDKPFTAAAFIPLSVRVAEK